MKIKGFFLISLIIISSIGLSVTAFYSKDGMYSPYWGSILDRPILSTVLTAAANGVYPWSPDTPVKKPQADACGKNAHIVEPTLSVDDVGVDTIYYVQNCHH